MERIVSFYFRLGNEGQCCMKEIIAIIFLVVAIFMSIKYGIGGLLALFMVPALLKMKR